MLPVPEPVTIVFATKDPVIFALPAVKLPVTDNELNVPTLVILGCAFVYTVPAINAFDTCPLTLAPATELAVVA